MADEQAAPETIDSGEIPNVEAAPANGIQPIPAQLQESPTVAVARERLVEAIGREAAFLADQRPGQASQGLEALARAFTLVTSPAQSLAPAGNAGPITDARGYLLVDQDEIRQRETVRLGSLGG